MTTPEQKVTDAPIVQEPVKMVEPEPNQPEIEEQPAEEGVTTQPVMDPQQVAQPQPQPDPVADDQTVTITIPATPQQLEDWSKGDPDDSLTWFAFFWIRIIKKAFAHGWKVVTGTMNQPAV